MTLHSPARGKAPKWLRQEWATPPHIFHALHSEFRFTVDAAARYVNAKLSRFWTKAEDGLRISWEGERVFVNPPYADPGAWLAKAWTEVWAGRCTVAALLVPAAFDVEWFDLASLGEVQPYRGRLQFLEPPELLEWREETGRSPKSGGSAGGAMVVVYRPETIRDHIPAQIPIQMRSAKSGLLLPERLVA